MNAMSWNFAREWRIASNETIDSLSWRLGQFIDITKPNTCYYRAQKQPPKLSSRKIDAEHDNNVFESWDNLCLGKISKHTRAGAVTRFLLLYVVEITSGKAQKWMAMLFSSKYISTAIGIGRNISQDQGAKR